MLAPSAPPNTSGNNVTTLIVSIAVFHGHPQPAPGLRRLPSDPCKAEQPLTVVGPPPRHGERPCDDAPVLVHHRSEEHTSLQSHSDLVCRLLLEKKKKKKTRTKK